LRKPLANFVTATLHDFYIAIGHSWRNKCNASRNEGRSKWTFCKTQFFGSLQSWFILNCNWFAFWKITVPREM
jgi:hypothetical protein